MAEHTPTPWMVTSWDDRTTISPVNEDAVIATLWPFMRAHGDLPHEANAAFIVKAVNMHEELVDALKACRRQMQNDWHDKPRIGMEAECEMADAVLAKL